MVNCEDTRKILLMPIPELKELRSTPEGQQKFRDCRSHYFSCMDCMMWGASHLREIMANLKASQSYKDITKEKLDEPTESDVRGH